MCKHEGWQEEVSRFLGYWRLSKSEFLQSIGTCSTTWGYGKDYEAFKEDDKYFYSRWHSGDNLQALEKKAEDPEKRKILYEQGYIDSDGKSTDNVVYKYNRHFFRSTEFTDEPGIACFGCSLTHGIGVDQEHTWPEQLSKLLDMPCYNLGTPGFGLDLGAFYAINWLQEDLPNLKAIVSLEPPPHRSVLVSKKDHNNQYHFSSVKGVWQDMDMIKPEYLDQYLNYVEGTGMMSNQWAHSTLELIAQVRGIPYITMHKHVYNRELIIKDDARDLSHYGKDTMATMAKWFANNYNAAV